MNTTHDLNTAAAIAEVREKTGHMREAATTLGHVGALLAKAANHLDAAEFIDHATGQPKRPVPMLNGLLRGKMTEAVMLAAGRCDRDATMAEMLLDFSNLGEMTATQVAAIRPAHQQRVIDELKETTGRRDKLHAFLESIESASISPDERRRMFDQKEIMDDLCEILQERIAAFA